MLNETTQTQKYDSIGAFRCRQNHFGWRNAKVELFISIPLDPYTSSRENSYFQTDLFFSGGKDNYVQPHICTSSIIYSAL